MTKKINKGELVCPSCKKNTKTTIGTYLKLPTTYYMSRNRFGDAWTTYNNIFEIKKDPYYKRKVLGFFCRLCGEDFPEEMNKEIWKWLKYRKILDELKK